MKTLIATAFTLILLLQPNLSMARECPDMILKCPNNEKTFSIKEYSPKPTKCMPVESDLNRAILSNCMSQCTEPFHIGKAATDAWLLAVNNCSAERVVDSGTDRLMEKTLGTACIVHDLCYSHEGGNKENCDDEFLYNMEKICDGVTEPGKTLCTSIAGTLYSAVHVGGGSSATFHMPGPLCSFPEFIETIEIDCSVKGTKKAGTLGKHRISIYDKNGTLQHTGRYKMGRGCDQSNLKTLARLEIPRNKISGRNFGKIVFQSRSNDALVIDKLVITFSDGSNKFWGTSNNNFFCLDTDLSTVGGTKCHRHLEYKEGKSGKVYWKD